MNVETRSVCLREWETLSPSNCDKLRGFYLDSSSEVRDSVNRLRELKLLDITELRQGTELRAFSHVGRLTLGSLSLSILPKIKGESLVRLLRYAYGFRRLTLLSASSQRVGEYGLEDLLISQLNAEIEELIHRGLLRSYVMQSEQLPSPRGRIDITRLAMNKGQATASLPCKHYPRIVDTPLNRVLLAGLQLAASMSSDIELRRESRRLASLLQEQVSEKVLDVSVLEKANRQMNRLTEAYSPALKIINLLHEAQGVSLHGQFTRLPFRGYLFDMNAFFQSLLSRFLRENLDGFSVRDEFPLKEMLRYSPEFNPQRAKPPTPRPDYVITDRGITRAILDAKYRDLWKNTLPREMLYQLVVYAISHPGNPQSTILYPSTDGAATEARIEVADSLYGRKLGRVCIRPVHLQTLLEVVTANGDSGRRRRSEYARFLAFGKN